jgi:hypothetical protein
MHGHRVGLDRDAPLLLEVHGVEMLVGHYRVAPPCWCAPGRRSDSVVLPWSTWAMICRNCGSVMDGHRRQTAGKIGELSEALHGPRLVGASRQTGQDSAGPQLPEFGSLRSPPAARMQSSHSTDATTCLTNAALMSSGRAIVAAGRVAEHGELRRGKRDRRQEGRERRARRLHQPGVVGPGDVRAASPS